MRGAASSPLIVVARVNETAARGGNPHLPLTPDEIVAEALRAHVAGAAVLHWHARDPVTGGLSEDPAAWRAVVEGVRAESDMLLAPGLGLIEHPADRRIAHITALAGAPRLRVDLAPVELGAFNIDFWDDAAGRFRPGDAIYQLTRDKIEAALIALRDAGVRATAACWGESHVRTARRFQQMGLLPVGALWELVFTGDAVPSAPAPTLPALEAYLAALPGGEPWVVYAWHADVLPLAEHAVALGGHVGIGLGDFEYGHLGTPDHGDLVRRVAALARKVGRRLATPTDARAILGVAPL